MYRWGPTILWNFFETLDKLRRSSVLPSVTILSMSSSARSSILGSDLVGWVGGGISGGESGESFEVEPGCFKVQV